MPFSFISRAIVFICLVLHCYLSLAAPPVWNTNGSQGHGNNGRHNGAANGRHHENDSNNGRHIGNSNNNGRQSGNGNGSGRLNWNGNSNGRGNGNNNGKHLGHWSVSDWHTFIEQLLQQIHSRPEEVRPEGSAPGDPGRMPESVPTWAEWLGPWEESLQSCGYPGTTPDLRHQDLRIATLPNDHHSFAQLGNYPWMVSLKWTQSGSHWCGGVLISDQWVLTAAHCLFSIPPFSWGEKFWTARLGVLNISSSAEALEQVFSVDKILVHPLFDRHMVLSRDSVGKPSDHDIALVKLSAPANINPFVRPLCLPPSDEIPTPGTRCVITGWGYSADSQQLSKTLKQAVVPIMAYENCKALEGYDKLLTPHVLCAGYVEGGVDACKFDSGGPLQCHDGEQWKLIGVVSWGDKNGDMCAQPLRPGVYTRVDAHVTWIQETIYRDFAGLPQISWDQILPNPLTHPRSYQKR